MPNRTDSQRKGDLGEAFVRYIVEKQGQWICRKPDKDYGGDFELEFELTEGQVTGKTIKVQVKATSNLEIREGFVIFRETKDFVRYAVYHTVPFIYVVVDLEKDAAYYLAFRNWYRENDEAKKISEQVPASITLRIPLHQTLDLGLKETFEGIAKGAPIEEGNVS
jgi:hypothetical protein